MIKGRVALVTGARGFIGSNLCAALLRQGAVVHGTTRGEVLPQGSKVRWHRVDTSDAASTQALLRAVAPDFIFHLAGYVNGGRGIEHVLPALQENCVATVNLLQAATQFARSRIVLANSLEEPGNSEVESPPCSPYAASKFAGTVYARMFHALYGTSVVTTRISMGYGPGQWDSRKVVPYVILSLLRGEAPQLSSGSRCCDWIYVDDVVDGLIAAALAPGAAGETVDIAAGELTSIRAVVLEIVDILKSDIKPAFGALPDRALERLRPADIQHAFDVTGWRPRVPLREGLTRTIDWCRKQMARGAFSERATAALQ